jgi:hypothetical protein
VNSTRSVGFFCLSFVVVGLAHAEALSTADRDRGLKYLESTKQNIIAATKGLSQAEWNFKPAPDRWSVAEVIEHIAVSEDRFLETITEKVMKAPPRPQGENVKEIDEFVLANVPDRTNKFKAPEPIAPKNAFGSPEASLKHFLESRERSIAFLKKTEGLRDHAIESPFKKNFDAYQWVLFLTAHSERHTKQIKEVRADAKFPKA